jgi:D-amino-acid oxidase
MDDVLVIGAGVIGLTTAISLAEAGARVRVVTAAPPAATTSAVAGAMWGRGPSVSEPAVKIEAWSAVTFTELVAQAEDTATTGVRLARGREATRQATALPALPQARSVTPCPPEDLPAGFHAGNWITVPIVDMPRYLGYLANRFGAAGGVVSAGEVRTMAEATGAPVIVNCTGVAAREFVPDDTVRPVRGQHVIVANPGLDEFFVEETDDTWWVSFFPHGDHVVLGGTAGEGDGNRTPDPVTADAIVRWCAAVEPRLADVPVLGHLVGLRPSRPSVRVAEERVNGTRWIHNYGHGGMGVTLSWGCARDVTAMLTTI